MKDQSLNLPIIKKLVETYQLWQNNLTHFPNTSRYTLGAKIDSAFIQIIEMAFIAAHQSQFRERERVNQSF